VCASAHAHACLYVSVCIKLCLLWWWGPTRPRRRIEPYRRSVGKRRAAAWADESTLHMHAPHPANQSGKTDTHGRPGHRTHKQEDGFSVCNQTCVCVPFCLPVSLLVSAQQEGVGGGPHLTGFPAVPGRRCACAACSGPRPCTPLWRMPRAPAPYTHTYTHTQRHMHPHIHTCIQQTHTYIHTYTDTHPCSAP
jgi:hypothetical protein